MGKRGKWDGVELYYRKISLLFSLLFLKKKKPKISQNALLSLSLSPKKSTARYCTVGASMCAHSITVAYSSAALAQLRS